ncbi:permease-like cell division protein FtsX [Aliikangiella coralliicola]|uniref:Cell division protein FtsX n=1 Tax=Aliikangiella coralliicola TaxID=2592383 RepID=A0A545UIH1_9GAMM|nr:permease-like cell division protein FtsX [Aliikangiella coralliicola]TQV89233.1 ABC transporter permease [Aliikangiella coralliicola]
MSNDQLTGASLSQGATLSARLNMLVRLHKIEARRGILDILANPISNFMTVLVIAIALALPAGLQILLENGKSLSENWDGASRISLYLKSDLSQSKLLELADKVSQEPGVANVNIITQQQALDDFKQHSGFAEAIEQLDSNPLPPVLVVQPAVSHASPEASEIMLSQFKTYREVELAQLDLDWVRKLYAMLQLAEKAASALGVALALAVLLIVGNTIRLSVQNRREEIEVVKLVGATDAFIRRPFLYTGFWYGLLSGVTCWLILTISLLWLQDPVANLAGLYQSQFRISGLGWLQSFQLISASCVLGLLGSWLSVGRHIRQIEPR